MKRGLLLVAAAIFGFTANAQITAGSVAMGAGYANQVFYKLSDNTSNTYPHASWDLAFLRNSNFGFATRVNEAKGIETYEASTNIFDWETIDVSQLATWTRLYNSETVWDSGAIDQGSATYGWGEYNVATHHVSGAVVFVLKYPNGTFRKFKIDDFFGGYTFTYSTYDGSAWSADTTVTLSNESNPTTRFNYYSLETNAALIAEPAETAWDLVFTKYNTSLTTDTGATMYNVTGVLHHPRLKVAENLISSNDITNLDFSSDINTIGYDWKTFSGTGYTINTDKQFFIKDTTIANAPIYRLVFSSFVGTTTGVITFNQEDATSTLATQNFANNVTFGVYPNPAIGKKINVVYDIPAGSTDKNSVTIYTSTGAKVFEQKIGNGSGFFNQELNLSNLNSGIYFLKFETGTYTTTKKIVLQ